MSAALIAIVGRPNVGKSSLFNALLGERISIVHDTPGVTRDRVFARCEWYGRQVDLADTGGIDFREGAPLQEEMHEQVDFAIDSADLVLFLADVQEGLQQEDRRVISMLRKAGKPVLLAVNKCDVPGAPPLPFFDFYELGVEEVFPISASHRLGLGELMEAALARLPEMGNRVEEQARTSVAIIGKPNVGKSSLLNRIFNAQRCIVSEIAGTTRDALDVDVDHPSGLYRFIDTAGLRRKSRIDNRVEKYSSLRTQAAIDRADVCLIVIDANEGLTEQDTKVAGLAHQAGKASIFVVNKWDLIAKDTKTMNTWRKDLLERFGFMRYAPSHFISALTGSRIEGLFPIIQEVYEAAGKRLGTGVMNEVLAEAVAMHRPPQDKGRQLKLYYMTQVDVRPPCFVFFINDKKLLHFSYERYLENRLRENFHFPGSPLRLIFRERRKTDLLRVKESKEESVNT